MTFELYQSPVVFSENPHGYRLGDKRMSGITSLIHQVLQLGVYPNASDYVKSVCIPRAGEYGSAIHKAIETYDKMGIKVTAHPKSPKFQSGIDDEYWIVADELETYIKHREGFTPLANEYTVSDEERYASNIDNVWIKDDTKGIWLVDTKSNNMDYYPGGAEGLKEYLSWQLSVYAYLFEKQNPGLKVEALACNWLRKGDGEFWVIDRQSDLDVQLLLSVPWVYTDNGFIYDGSDVTKMLKPDLSALVPAKEEKQIVPQKIVTEIWHIAKVAEEANKALGEMKEKLRDAMQSNGIKSWDSGMFKATIASDSFSESFDTTKFKKEHPDLYKQYIKQTSRKGAFTIKLKDKE